jgi:sodium-dependent dicarboxylate transporter 2/3/5
MCLPISTPPNAIAYGTGELETRDLLQGGLILGLLAPIIANGWCWLVL